MIPYKNLNLSSPVLSYDYGADWIRIEWLSGDMQTFRHHEVGKRHVDQMIKFAKLGKGLCSYIEKNKNNFKPDKKKSIGFRIFGDKSL